MKQKTFVVTFFYRDYNIKDAKDFLRGLGLNSFAISEVNPPVRKAKK